MQILIQPTQSSYIINKSKFLGFSYYVQNLAQIKEILISFKDKYRDASHICYAYVLGSNQEIQKYDDNGEPHHTAGYPILELLLKQKISNCLIIVVRYFGGTKLGTGNLMRSYVTAAQQLIENNLAEYCETKTIKLEFSYSLYKQVDHFVNTNNIKIINKLFNANTVVLTIEIASKVTIPVWINNLVI